MNTKNYTMGTFEELFEDYSVVPVNEYFNEIDRETIQRNRRVAREMTQYLKAHKTPDKYAAIRRA